MGFFSKIFGGESAKGPKIQKEENRIAREFNREQTDKGVSFLKSQFPQAQETMRQGINAGLNTRQMMPWAQMQPVRQSSLRAQEAVLGGANAYQNAILGMPTGLGANPYQNPVGLQPKMIGARQPMLAPFQDVPQFESPQQPSYQRAFSQGGAGSPWQNPLAGIQSFMSRGRF